MLSIYLWSDSPLSALSSTPAGRQRSSPRAVAEVLSRLSGLVTDSIIASGMEVLSSFVFVPQQETQTFYLIGLPACGGTQPHIYVARQLFELQGGRM